MSEKYYSIGVDLGGTKIDIALVDEQGVIIEKSRLATDVKGGPTIIEAQILAAIRGLPQVSDGPLLGLGIGVAGQIEQLTGRIHFAPNLNWHNVPLQQDLARVLSMPIVVANDVRVATWGEWLYGAGKGSQDLVCLFVGTGIGGGIISGGRLLIGRSNTFGEIGHTTVDLHGAYCTCGNRGCLETLAGGWAVAKRAKEAAQRDPKAGALILKLVDGQFNQITAKIVVQAMRMKDPLAEILIEQTIQALIAGCVGFVNAFNPGRLILGGGLVEGVPEIITRVDKGIRQRALKAASAPLEVVHAALGVDSGVIGAAAMAQHVFAPNQK